MMNDILSAFGVGVEAAHLTVLQVALRAVLIFFATLIIVRFADKRFLAKKTAFDFILAVILASMMARAINGSEQLGPTIVAGFLLAFLHRGLGLLAFKWPRFSGWIKGYSQTIIEDGRIRDVVLHRHHFGKDDLAEELRLGGVIDPAEVKHARLERSGEVSVIRK